MSTPTTVNGIPTQDLVAYGRIIKSLAKPGKDIVADLKVTSAEILHAAVGIVGELHELQQAMANASSEEHILEELGDVLFYTFYLDSLLPYDLDIRAAAYATTKGKQLPRAHLRLPNEAFTLLDTAKKLAIYNKPLTADVAKELITCVYVIMSIIQNEAQIYAYTMDEIMAANIAKLSKRYPGLVYANGAAQARLDKVGTEHTQ